MKAKVIIENINCESCKNAVIKRMKKEPGISNIKINKKSRVVYFSYTTHNVMEGLRHQLEDLGFPITTDLNTV